MLFQVPDVFVCDDPDNQVAGCDPTATVPATSYRNQFYGNKMGMAPNGKRQAERRGLLVGPGRRLGRPDAQHGELLVQQHGPDGTAASVTGLPSPSGAPPNNLPSNCAAAHRLAP